MSYVAAPSSVQRPPAGAVVNWSHHLSSRLQGLWLFNEGSGLGAFDLASGTSASAVNSPGWAPSAGSGGGRTFNGSTQYLNAGIRPALINYDGLELTIAARFVLSSNPGGRACLTGVVSDTSSQYKWALYAIDNQFVTKLAVLDVFTAVGNDYLIARSTTLIQINTPYFLVGVCAIGTAKRTPYAQVYLNGRREANVSASGAFNTNVGSPAPELAIGQEGSGRNTRYFPGTISYLAIWDRALRDDEVVRLSVDPYAMLRVPPVARFPGVFPTKPQHAVIGGGVVR